MSFPTRERTPDAAATMAPPANAYVRLAAMAGMQLLVGVIVTTFLFVAIYRPRRDWPGYADYSLRGDSIVLDWLDQGYLHRGGLLFGYNQVRKPATILLPGEDPTVVYTSQNGVHLLPLFLLQKARVALVRTPDTDEARPRPRLIPPRPELAERYDYGLTRGYYVAGVALESALFGLLAARLAWRAGATGRGAALLGAASQAMLLTNPSHLLSLWELNTSTLVQALIAAFLVSEEPLAAGESGTFWRGRALIAFAMGWGEAKYSAFFLAAYALSLMTLAPEANRLRRLLSAAIPMALGAALFLGQIAFVHVRYPHLEDRGSEFLFRTGLDGSRRFFTGHADLIRHEGWTFLPHSLALYVAGGLALAAVVLLSFRLEALRSATFILVCWAACFVTFAFVFPQAIVIHVYELERLFVPPLILAVFAVLPAVLERTTAHRGVFIFAAVAGAFCWSFVQLRTFAVAVPLS